VTREFFVATLERVVRVQAVTDEAEGQAGDARSIRMLEVARSNPMLEDARLIVARSPIL
jgi:hypothetical protein